ncbi:capsular biosynthesis protein [Sphingomonas sp.]|jgi:capsular polysaccharide export protein|uniref:capsule biosynthesis protein n=1 Tax=Sphingomonas sp. TaxID=28214 RepID=UPI00179E25CC|nr:capsular biosynthesis protein [Sphingomonas sp.]MBA4760701.1 capsular biosynthesis protein [Sphingomonas sp.]
MDSLARDICDARDAAVAESVDAFEQCVGSQRAARHYLFLQGLPGPFFRRLGEALRADGARVSRINFNGGDMLDWPGRDAFAYRGTPADWPAWLDRFVRDRGVTDIIVFGDLRPVHRVARVLADRRGLRFVTFEEGYLRPNHVTLERGGVNGHSSFPRGLHALRLIAARAGDLADEVPVANSFRRRASQSAFYYAATHAAAPFFAHYRTHRHASPLREGVAWLRRYVRRGRERRASQAAVAGLAGRRFFLFPLQLEGDAQIRVHSRFDTMRDAVVEVLAAFRDAPEDVALLVKQHPLDPDVDNWRGFVTDRAAQLGLADRVVFIERFDLTPLLKVAHGVVTVNSSVGPLALAAGVPVKTLGTAIYDVPGITADVPLDRFWHAPPPVDAEAFDIFCRALRAKCLVNGGFHGTEALDLLVRNAVTRLRDR